MAFGVERRKRSGGRGATANEEGGGASEHDLKCLASRFCEHEKKETHLLEKSRPIEKCWGVVGVRSEGRCGVAGRGGDAGAGALCHNWLAVL
jgi:hypothetical protein